MPDELPSDPAELRAFAAALLERCARLERLLKLAKDAQFGRSSERLDADQLQLVLEDIDQAVAALEAAEDRAFLTTAALLTKEVTPQPVASIGANFATGPPAVTGVALPNVYLNCRLHCRWRSRQLALPLLPLTG